MAQLLKQSTAFTFRIGPFQDSTGALLTSLTIAQADIQISKNGGAYAQTSASPTTTHDADGWYQCPLTATDTGTLGTLTVQISGVSTSLPVWKDFMVVPANVYDSLVGGTDTLNADVTQVGGVAISTGTAQLGVNIVNVGGAAVTAASGRMEVNTSHWAGTAVATPTTAGVPEVDITFINGAAVSTSTAQLGVNAVQAGGTAWGSGAITAASIATGAVDADALADDAVTEIADGILNRDFASVSDTNSRTLLNAARLLRNKTTVSAGTLTVTEENDSTTAWTAAVTTNSSAEPITGIDPA